MAHFAYNVLIYISYWITKKETILTALIISAIFAIVPMFLFITYDMTPIELFKDKEHAECKKVLEKMYINQYDARRRYEDINNMMQLTDKYKTSVFKLIFFPPQFRNALIIGIVIGLSQGIINVFFENYLCRLVENEITYIYCQEQIYSLDNGFSYIIFLHVLAIIPTLSFLYYFE